MSQEEKDFNFKDLFIPLTNKKAILWIIAVGFIVYFNMLFNGFVWDDNIYIILNPAVHQVNIFNLFGSNLYNYLSYYRPIFALYSAITYSLFHETPFFYHVVQLALHITNTILVFLIFKKFFNRTIGFLMSLIFLVHPIQVEAVSYIAGSGDTLYFAFGIFALFLTTLNLKPFKRIIIFIFLLLSVLSKEAGILFFPIILLYSILFKKGKEIMYTSFGLFVSIVIYLVLRFEVAKVNLAKISAVPIAQLTLNERLFNIPAILFYYIKTFFYPYYLAVDQMWIIKKISLNTFYLPLMADIIFLGSILTIGVLILLHKKKNFREYLFFTIWFLIGMSIYMQFFPLDLTVEDKWFYFPIVGLLGILSIIQKEILERNKKITTIFVLTIISIIMLLSLRTMLRNVNWRNEIPLYSHDINIEDNFDIENNLGGAYISNNDYEKAIVHLKKSITLSPNEAAFTNLGLSYWRLGKLQDVENYYIDALKTKNILIKGHKHYANTYIYYSEFLIHGGSFAKALQVLNDGILDYPDSSRLWFYLAYSKYELGDKKDALKAASKAKDIDSNNITNFIYNRIKSNLPIEINIM